MKNSLEKILTSVGEQIKKVRTEQHLSQADLAARCGMEKATISRIEGGRVNVTFSTVLRVCKGLNIEANDLIRKALEP